LETTTATKIFLISFFVNATRSFLQKEEKGWRDKKKNIDDVDK
jgi:hypothetical protein